MSLQISALCTLSGLLALPGVAIGGRLNDTGIDFCGGAQHGNQPCTGTVPLGQDAHSGRDAAAASGTLTKVGGGRAGFDFVKISNAGDAVSVSAGLGPDPTDWACTRDQVTGLTWEVKTDDGGLRDQEWSYTWYDPNSPDDDPGDPGAQIACADTLAGLDCNTASFVAAVNAAKLCGQADWRLPTIQELEGIADLGTVDPALDRDYFPNTPSEYYWSASPFADQKSQAWNLDCGYGNAFYLEKHRNLRVRLVRGQP